MVVAVVVWWGKVVVWCGKVEVGVVRGAAVVIVLFSPNQSQSKSGVQLVYPCPFEQLVPTEIEKYPMSKLELY